MTTEPNPYVRLGLTPGSPPAEIKRRYRQLAKQYHPDLNGNTSDSEEKLRALNAAYALLSDPARKEAYDNRVGTLFNPVPLPRRVPPLRRQQSRPHRAAAGLGLALLVSAGVGAFVTTGRSLPDLSALAKILPQASRPWGAGTDNSGPDFSFLPSRSAFDEPSSPDTGSRDSRDTVKP